jgi:hypothetical protein
MKRPPHPVKNHRPLDIPYRRPMKCTTCVLFVADNQECWMMKEKGEKFACVEQSRR